MKKGKNKKVIRDGFVFYRSFYEVFKNLGQEQILKLFFRICEYGLNGNDTQSDDMNIEALFVLIKPQLDANNRRYLNSLKGGAPKGSHNNPLGRGYKKKEPSKISEVTITTETSKYVEDEEKENETDE
jgi:hypothetical protein